MQALKLFMAKRKPNWNFSLTFSILAFFILSLIPGQIRAEFTYKLTVKTGWKGTNADMMISMVGTKGVMDHFQLLDNPNRDDFEPNRVDEFLIYLQEDLGVITDFILKPRGPGLSVDNWKMEYIKVENLNYPGKITTFVSTPVFSGSTKYPFYMRATEFKDPNVTAEILELPFGNAVTVGFVNFGKPSADSKTITATSSQTQSYSLENSSSTSIMNSWSISAETTTPGVGAIPEIKISATYAGSVTNNFTETTTSAIANYNEKSQSQVFTGEGCMATFHIYQPMETKVIGTVKDGLGGTYQYSKVTGNFIPQGYVTYVFRAVDDKANGSCTNCPSFQELYELAGLPGQAPNGPTLADIAATQVGGCNVDVSDVVTPTPTPTPNPGPVTVNNDKPSNHNQTTTKPPKTRPKPAKTSRNKPDKTSRNDNLDLFQCIQSAAQRDQFIHNANEIAQVGAVQTSAFTVQWKMVPAGNGWVKIQSRENPNHYLHAQNGKIEAGAIQNGWEGALWKLEDTNSRAIRIQNKKNTDYYIHNQNGALEVGPIQDSWKSAMWVLKV